MDSVIQVLSGLAGSQPLEMFLLDVILKSSLLILFVLFATRIFSTLSSARKHYIWGVTFFILFMMPVLSLVLPRWEVPVTVNEFSEFSENSSTVNRGIENDIAEQISFDSQEKKAAEIVSDSLHIDSVENESTRETVAEAESLIYTLYTSTTAFGNSLISNNRFLLALLTVWCVGFVLLVLKRVIAHLMIYRTYMNSVELDEEEWHSVFFEIKANYKISRSVTFLKNNKIKSPMTWGIIRPKILIPSEMESLSEERKRYILLHEFAHIKRMDVAIQHMTGIVCMIHWFNPLVWFANKRMLNECEHACDNYVLEKCENPSNYANLLLEVAGSSLKWNHESSVVISMARKNHLERRLLSILNKKIGRSKVSLFTACATFFGIFLLVTPLIMFSPLKAGSENPENIVEVSGPAFQNTQDFLLNDNENSRVIPVSERLESIGIQDTSTVAALTHILYDDDESVRLQAAESLGKIGTPEAINSIILSLKRNQWNDLDEVVDIFSSLKNSYPVQTLMESIKTENTDIRQEAVFSLNDAPNVNALIPLCKYMEDEDSDIREESAKGLGRIGVPEILDCLTPYLKDDEEDVRVEVVEAIGRIQDQSAVSVLSEALKDESSEVREEAASALGAIREPAAIHPLSFALNDESSDVREEAAEALGKIGDTEAIEALTNALNRERDNDVKREIMSAIGNIYSAVDE